MSNVPQVSVICLCYNQARWIEEAVMSVVNQTYPNVQLIIMDDGSMDNSALVIRKLSEQHPSIEIILSNRNRGNCAAFNEALKKATGQYVIDFAADDVMMPNRIARQVELFHALGKSYGVIFTDAEYIDGGGKFIRGHYDYLFRKRLIREIPQGDVYREVLARYFIASPTMMIRKEVLEKLGGYDESLVYEDFDFWVRSSRIYKYGFVNESLTRIRRSGQSMSSGWYQIGDKQLHSTYLVCRKAMTLNKDEADVQALLKRIRYEIRQSVFSGNHREAKLFFGLLKELKRDMLFDRTLQLLNSSKLPMGWLRRIYHSVRFK